MANPILWVVGAGLGALWLLRRRAAPTESSWNFARLTEYYPDAPVMLQRQEGGPHDCKSQPLHTVEQHQADPVAHPYVSVSSDVRLNGKAVLYGTRIYFRDHPTLTFRIVDTGGNFVNPGTPIDFPARQCGMPKEPGKEIRMPGYEPFDIATHYGSTLKISGTLTQYRVDPTDLLPWPLPRVA